MNADFDLHPAEQWTPARRVPKGVTCAFCWTPIPPGVPGNTTGTRGTKAWYNAFRREWECLGCRSEAMRAQIAREAGR